VEKNEGQAHQALSKRLAIRETPLINDCERRHDAPSGTPTAGEVWEVCRWDVTEMSRGEGDRLTIPSPIRCFDFSEGWKCVQQQGLKCARKSAPIEYANKWDNKGPIVKRARSAPFWEVARALVHNVRERRWTMLHPEGTPVALLFSNCLPHLWENWNGNVTQIRT